MHTDILSLGVVSVCVYVCVCVCGWVCTMVVSVMEPKLLIKMLQVTLTGGPEKWKNNTIWSISIFLKNFNLFAVLGWFRV